MTTRSTFEQRSICTGLSKPPNQQIDAASLALNCEFPCANCQKLYFVLFRGRVALPERSTPFRPSAPVQRRLQGPPAKSKFLAVKGNESVLVTLTMTVPHQGYFYAYDLQVAV